MSYTKGPWRITDMGTLIQAGGNENRPIEVAGINIAHFSKYQADTHQIANSHLIAAAPELLDALRETRKLVSEAATVGFNYEDGDWAERLFFNQQSISNAIAKAEGKA